MFFMYLFIKKCSNKKSIWQTQQQHRDKLKRTSITEKIIIKVQTLKNHLNLLNKMFKSVKQKEKQKGRIKDNLTDFSYNLHFFY